MADEKDSGEGHYTSAFILVALFVGLIVLWYANGGPERADLRGIFLAPPAPVGSGDAYGPQLGEPQQNAPAETGPTESRPSETRPETIEQYQY